MGIRLTRILPKRIALFVSTLVMAAGMSIALVPVQKAEAANGAIWPTTGTITSRYQDRCHAYDSNHWGFDIGAPQNTPIFATQDGTVANHEQISGYTSNGQKIYAGYGKYVDVTHANGWMSRYAHMVTHEVVGNGGFVRQGDLIGYVGNTGNGSGPHLHFEMRLNGTPQDTRSAAACGAGPVQGIEAHKMMNYNFNNLVSTTAQTQLANVNSCGALYIKRTYWGNWDQHMGCGQATRTALSPDGNTIAAIRPDGMMIAKDSYWGNWVQQYAPAKDVAVGNNGYIAVVDTCGAVKIKQSFHGGWNEHMGCGQAKGVSMSGDGNIILVTRPDNTLVGKDSHWGGWVAHSGVGDSQDSAVSSNGYVASVNGCGALYIKRGYWANWEHHMGCGQAKEVALSPNGEAITVVRPDNTLISKQTYWGSWQQHVGVGDTQHAAVANP